MKKIIIDASVAEHFLKKNTDASCCLNCLDTLSSRSDVIVFCQEATQQWNDELGRLGVSKEAKEYLCDWMEQMRNKGRFCRMKVGYASAIRRAIRPLGLDPKNFRLYLIDLANAADKIIIFCPNGALGICNRLSTIQHPIFSKIQWISTTVPNALP